MKKLISLVLVLVLVFSLAVPSFAYPHSSTQMEALNEIEYWTYWIFQDFTGYFTDTNGWLTSIWQILTNSIASNVDLMETDVDSIASNMVSLVSRSESSLSNLLDINEYLRSVNDEITSLNDNLFGSLMWIDPFAAVIQKNSNTIVQKLDSLDSNIAQLKEVLADDEDLAFKESQKENQQYVQDTFFSPDSDLSLNLDKLGDFTDYVESFKTSFDFSSVGTESPLDMVGEGSDFSKWFSEETALSIDPTYGGGSGGGGETPDPDEPDPDEPDPDEPDPDEPDPDEPDPPAPTIKNWLPLATSEPGGSEIYNGIGYLPGYRWSDSANNIVSEPLTSISGFIPCNLTDIVYLYGLNITSINAPIAILFNDGSRVYSLRISNIEFDNNGVYSFRPSDFVSSCNYFRVVFYTEGSENGVISINQYPIQTASTFSLRAQSVPYQPEIVTSAYADRMNEFYKLLGGDD